MKNTMTGHDICYIVLFLLTMNTKLFSIQNLLQCFTVDNLFVGKYLSLCLPGTNTGHPFPLGFIPHCSYTFWHREATVHCYYLSCVPKIPAHAKHQSHCLSTIFKLLWSKLWWPIFYLNKINIKHDLCTFSEAAIADCVVLIAKRIRHDNIPKQTGKQRCKQFLVNHFIENT